jgi:transcription factor IIIB subunit 2
MPLAKPIIRPRAPPAGRLHSLRTPQPGAIPIKRPQGQQQQQQQRQQSQQPQQQPQKFKNRSPDKPAETCPNPNCTNPRIISEEAMRVCASCGSVISEDTLVSEISFGETSAGAAVVQGSYVGADQTHTRSSGPGFHRGGGMESREITEQNGNRYIQQMALALDIPESAQKAAGQVFKLAVGLNFIQGRRTKTVAAVCLYIACRRQAGNTVMLIDLSDVLMINVFKVGRAYKLLLEELRLGGTIFTMNPVDPENLILRFAKQLEFGPRTMHVAKEAVLIVQRMSRDWMTTGRRPAGICGAALILAARMNNFRRTVREVVYVVKVTEVTINQRLNEFSSTDSGDLTVDQFRSVQLENAHDPPSFSQSKSKSRRRKAAETAAEIEEEEDDDDDDDVSTPDPVSTQSNRPKRVDADGFTIPDIPIDPALTAMTAMINRGQKRKASDNENLDQIIKTLTDSETSSATDTSADDGTPQPSADASAQKLSRSRNKQPLPEPTPEELASEEALENEMNQFLAQGSDMVEAATMKVTPSATMGTPAVVKTTTVSDSAEIDAAEFESDPEVANCLLSTAEVEIKERIWVHENRDYLRTQQAKALKRALQEGEGGDGTVKRPRKPRKGRIGDVTYLEGQSGGNSRASTPVEAMRMMLEQRAHSKKINYKTLLDLYGDDGKTEAEKSSRSQSVEEGRPSGTVGEENIKPSASSTEKEKAGGFNEADYDDDEEDEVASVKGYDDDQDIETAFAGGYDDAEEDYYDQASDYGD